MTGKYWMNSKFVSATYHLAIVVHLYQNMPIAWTKHLPILPLNKKDNGTCRLWPPRPIQRKTRTHLRIYQKWQAYYKGLSSRSKAKIGENSANNSAKSYNLVNAIKGEYPNQEIDYSKVRLTEGALPAAENAEVISVSEGFKFTWIYDDLNPLAAADDKTMLLAYLPDEKTRFYMVSGVERRQCQQVLQIDEMMRGQEAETYISFITDSRKSISNSVYPGKILF